MSIPTYEAEFTAALWRVPGDGGWYFVVVPKQHAPGVTLGWGRTPVHATVDGHAWQTSVWREKTGRTLLAVPKKVRGRKDDGDSVHVRLEYNIEYRVDDEVTEAGAS
jgi:hypothetical protein